MSEQSAALLRRVAGRLPMGAGCERCGDSLFNHLQCAARLVAGEPPCPALAGAVEAVRAEDAAAAVRAAGVQVEQLQAYKVRPLHPSIPEGGL